MTSHGLTFETCPERFRPPLLACAGGRMSPTMALTQMLMEAHDGAELSGVLDEASSHASSDPEASARIVELHALAQAHPGAWACLNGILDAVRHDAPFPDSETALARWAAMFDHAAGISPEASVALYSFGDAELLAAATGEVVARMDAWGLLRRDSTLLEIGCGIGHFQAALSPRIRRAIGIDISAAMVETARQRCADLGNVEILPCSGRDLAPFEDAAFDCVFSVDSFPYIVQAGLAAAHFREAARVLKPGGDLLILNFSYRGDPSADRCDFAHFASEAGFTIVQNGEQPFDLWDGTVFQAAKATGL